MDIGIKKVLGSLVRKLRQKHSTGKLTQKQFSELSGLHINTIHLLERGINEAKMTTFIYVARAFEMEPEALMKLLMEEYYSGTEKEAVN